MSVRLRGWVGENALRIMKRVKKKSKLKELRQIFLPNHENTQFVQVVM